jgi:hypothetical protein
LLHLLQETDTAARRRVADLVALAACVAAVLRWPRFLRICGTRDQVVRLAISHGQALIFFIGTRSTTCRLFATKRVVDVKRARSGTIRGKDDDVVERYLLDIKQRAIDVVGARLGRTVTLAAVTVGLDLTARRGGIGGFDAYGVNA